MKFSKLTSFFIALAALLLPVNAMADITISAAYTDSEGHAVNATGDFSAEAPLHVHFSAAVSALSGSYSLEWRFSHTGADGTSSLTRYSDETDFDFTESGLTVVLVMARRGDDIVDSTSIRVTISESHLEMPNAFSPNGDGVNDIYRAKPGYKSIVSFHAYIYNRWGQMLYDWTNIEGGWDGTSHGHQVKDGVYFVLVKARGADGIDYEIKRDITLMRRHNDSSTGTNP